MCNALGHVGIVKRGLTALTEESITFQHVPSVESTNSYFWYSFPFHTQNVSGPPNPVGPITDMFVRTNWGGVTP